MPPTCRDRVFPSAHTLSNFKNKKRFPFPTNPSPLTLIYKGSSYHPGAFTPQMGLISSSKSVTYQDKCIQLLKKSVAYHYLIANGY